MNYVIGEAIRKKIQEKGMTFVSFADRFGITDRNLQHFFKKSDISLQQITRASQILDYDFVKEYFLELKKDGKQLLTLEEPAQEYQTKEEHISTCLTIVGSPVNFYSNFSELLKLIISEAKKKGFTLK